MRSMDIRVSAAQFKALGDPTRLRILLYLRDCCGAVSVGDEGEVCRLEGPTAGQVCCHVTGIGKVSSAISFHLKELRNAGLITMERRGKHMLCSIDTEALAALAAVLSTTPRHVGAVP